jgi:peptide/nickel transport system substrate-binding protein
MDAWMRVTFEEGGIVVWQRNPYYFAVDPEGNQLPYFDEYHHVITGGTDVSLLRAINGDVSWFLADLDAYVVAKQAERDGTCRVFPWASSAFNPATLAFNVTHEDPVLRALFKDINFKMGVSHALNREQYNELVYHGLSEPWQAAPIETDPFYHEEAAHVALEYDPGLAVQYLEKAGLGRKNSEGFRLRSDGKVLEITMLQGEVGWSNEQAIIEMVVEDLNKIGIKTQLKYMDWSAASTIANANQHDVIVMPNSWGSGNGSFAWASFVNSYTFGFWGCYWARTWNQWWLSGGTEGEKPDQIMLDVMDWLAQSGATTDMDAKKGYWKKIMDVYVDNLWEIGTVKHPGQLLITAPYMRNVPNTRRIISRGDYGRWDVMYSAAE